MLDTIHRDSAEHSLLVTNEPITEGSKVDDRLNLNWKGLRVGRRIFYAVLLGLSLVGAVMVLAGTRWGPALSDDSFTYITSARNLIDGLGFGEHTVTGQIIPLAHFPPLLPLILAAYEFLGISAIAGVRWLNAALFSLTIITIGLALHWMTKSHAFALIGAGLVLLSEVMIGVHVEAMSEGLYLWLGLLGLFLLAVFASSGNRWYLVASAIAIGFAFLTRYIGLALVAAAVIGLLLNSRASFRQRLNDAGLFLVASLAPMVVWGIRNYVTIGNITDRTADWHPIGIDFIRAISNRVFIWLIPGRFVHGQEFLIAVALIALLSVLAVVFLRRASLRQSWHRWWSNRQLPTLELLLAIYGVTFLAMFLISKSIYDPAIYVIDRLLSPLHQVMLILLVVALAKVWGAGSRIGRSLLVGFIVFFIALSGFRTFQTVKRLYEDGLGYTSRAWHGSNVIEAVRHLENTKIFTNAVPAIYFWTGRTAHTMHGLDAVKQSLEADCAVLVVFDSIELWLFGTSQEEVAEGLQRLDKDIGDLYYHPRCTEELSAEFDS